MKKVLEWLKNNLLVICITLILGMTINAMAETILPSSGVSYSNSKTSETTVNGALDELFEAVKINEKIVEIEDRLDGMLDKAYPVGSIYISVTSTNPGSIIGGTWESFGTGRTLVGVNTSDTKFNTVQKTGGASSVTLTEAQLPSHSHNISHTHTTATNTITNSGAHTHSTTEKTISTGYLSAVSNGAHKHKAYTINYGLESNASGNTVSIFGVSNYYTNIQTDSIASAGAHGHDVTGKIPSLSIASSGAHTHTVPSLSTNSISTTESGKTGSGSSVSVQDPYITVYMWKRTA